MENQVADNVLSVCGVALGIANIESILGIIVLCVQLVLILARTGFKVYNKYKQKKFDEIEEDIQQAIDETKNLMQESEDKSNGK